MFTSTPLGLTVVSNDGSKVLIHRARFEALCELGEEGLRSLRTTDHFAHSD